MHAAADAADAAGDEHRVARVAPLQDHLVAAEEAGDGVGLEDLARLEVDDGVERQRPGHAGDRVEIDVLEVPVAPQQVLNPGAIDLPRLVGVGVRHAPLEPGAALLIELDGQVLEAHG